IKCANACATATTAGGFFPPDLVTIRQNFSFRKHVLIFAAAQAHSVSALRSHGSPPVVWLLLFLPALRLFPGRTPAHELKCFSSPTCCISVPVSARMVAALTACTPGTLCRSSHWASRPLS